MAEMSRSTGVLFAAAALALGGCVAVPAQPTYTVIPGQGKTEANLRADDAACRRAPAAATTTRTAEAPAVTAEQYYACMASRGEAVIEEVPRAYPAYAYTAPAYVPYAYPPVVAYPYAYPGYLYPYGAGYVGPYVGFGIGFGYGGLYGGRAFHRIGYGYGGYRGFREGGFHEGFRGSGFHEGGFHEGGLHRGGFHR